MAFNRRRQELKKENEMLQSHIKQLIDGTIINDASIKRSDNALLTITGNIMSSRAPSSKQIGLT